MKQLLPIFVFGFWLAAQAAYAQATATATVTIGSEAGLIVSPTPALNQSGGAFGSFTGATALTYFVRTSQSGGGNIQLQVTSDFAPATGPVAAGSNLKYTCTASNPGNSGTATPCAGPVTASTTAQTLVTSFGPNATSSNGGNSASVQWTLKNDPSFKAGSYSATVTFTISAN